MNEYFTQRIADLRARYARTAEAKWRYKLDEAERAYKHYLTLEKAS
jgi:hypothetical protein